MNAHWRHWLDANWAALERGDRVVVPAWLGHPAHAGFTNPPLAEPVGQTADWVLSLTDGSRLHIHEFPGGRWVAHRDRIDPAGGLADALAHWLLEAPSGQLAVGVGMLAAFVGGIAMLAIALDET